MKVHLTNTEMMVAAYIGSARNVQALKGKWETNGQPVQHTWGSNIEGAAGEIAVAKELNIYWQPVVGNPSANDVGPYQVRTNTSRRLDDLCLRPPDRPDRIYISVLSFLPEYMELVGWIPGTEGKHERWLRDGTPGRPRCYYVPRAELYPMLELPGLITRKVAA